MALSLQGWLNGLSASGIVIFGCVLGLFCIYKSRKTNAKLLFYMGLIIIFAGLGWLGSFIDFLIILLTGKNVDNSYGLVGLLCYMWTPLFYFFAAYIFAELVIPNKKRFILSMSLILGIIFEIFMFLDTTASFEFVYPATSGEDLIDMDIIFNSPLGILFFIIMTFMVIIGFGLLYKGIQSEGVIRKKFLFISIGTFIIIICAAIETLFYIIIIFARIGILAGLWLFYLGIREEPEKKERLKPKKEVKVKGDFFRISQYKKEDLTEEEVSISKEKKICLVCKGKLSRHNIYICPGCDTFYCQKCAYALENLENACWVCETPFDESKPVKPFKKEEEMEEIEISEKPQKKPKTKK